MDLFAHGVPPSVTFSFRFQLSFLIMLPVIADDHNLVTAGPEAALSPLEAYEVFGHKRRQSKYLKASFHLEILNGILDVAASCDKVLDRCPTIAYETGQ